eukprot:TRINITY_DN5194_c0_g1_i2.p1 TRINITY_DN5194_c0_g1~~TRINITY_DN5194_c0_g1_i2.p1  ORF type:complete len:104 (+),score=11.23 TRINITY_DN5194_c0_g1_i2:43-312(+)
MNNFLSKTFAGQVRTLGTKSKYLLAATCMFAIVQKQKHYRSRLQDEEEGTHDRVSREAHVILPDGRMAQVCLFGLFLRLESYGLKQSEC